MTYKIHPKHISIITKIYADDTNNLLLNGNKQTTIKITNGIRQGCNASTFLFIILTYEIINQLQAMGIGFKNENCKIPILYYAHDSLLLSHSIEETTQSIRYIQQVAQHYGLEINKEKSNILIYNKKEQPISIEDIQVT